MSSPTVSRLNAVQPDGYITPSGLSSFRERFRSVDSAKTFDDWASLPVTKLVRAALQSMVLAGPPGATPQEVEVQYGFTTGLSFALQMLTDPSIVFPELFTDSAKNNQLRKPLEPDYSTSALDALDNMQ